MDFDSSGDISWLEIALVLSLIIFGIFAFLMNSSIYMTSFYGVPSTGGLSSSPDKARIIPVPGSDSVVFSPSFVPDDVSADDQQKALAMLSSVAPSVSSGSGGVVPFAMSASDVGDVVVDPYRERSIEFMGVEEDVYLFSSTMRVPIGGFGGKEVFGLGSFVYRGYVFTFLKRVDDRVLFSVSLGKEDPVYFVCLLGVPNYYYDADSDVYLKALVRGDRVRVWSRGG